MSKKVFIVGGPEYDYLVTRLFIDNDWTIVSSIKEADLVQFTGGEDINPSLYGKGKHPETYFSPDRDKMEILAYQYAKELKKVMVGICRGGQLLNVMCGGSMWQHVNNHCKKGGHECINNVNGDVWKTTSVHHQMMIPSKDAFILDEAFESTEKEQCDKNGTVTLEYTYDKNGIKIGDPEVVLYYQPIRILCFQGHPEYGGFPDCTKRYFDYIEEWLF